MTQTLKQKIEPRIKLDGFTEEEKGEIVSMLERIVKEKVFIAILESLSHEEKTELGQMSEGEYTEKLSAFLEPKFTQFEEIIEKSLSESVAEFNGLRS